MANLFDKHCPKCGGPVKIDSQGQILATHPYNNFMENEPLTDEEFKELKRQIKEAYSELERLQKIYVRETGRRMIV